MSFSPKEYAEALYEILESDVKQNNVAESFAALLVKNKDVKKLKVIYEELSKIEKEKSGIINIVVEVASSISSDEKINIKEKLESKLGKKVDLEVKVKKELIAGAKYFIGDKVYDASIKNKLEVLRKNISSY